MFARYMFHLLKLRKNLQLDPSRLRELQMKRLKAIVKHAYENVPFYHRKFDRAGIRPDDIRSTADLCKIPPTTKSEIQSNPLGDVIARNIDANDCVKRTTSGSTGMPLTVLVDRNAEDFQAAVWARTFLENGLRLSDKMAVIDDPRHFPTNRNWLHSFELLEREYISVFDSAKTQLMLLEEFKPDVIKSYPSSLIILSDVYKAVAFKPRLIFTSAELLDDTSRSLISSTFEAELLDNYASYEFSLMAWECSQHMGYHLNVDSVLMEFLSNGEAVASGESGEIVCTSLINYAMPLIRYRSGDFGVPVEEQCSCGRSLPLLKTIEGRADDFLIALDGRAIAPTVFFPYPFEGHEGIRQFRVIQEKINKLTIQLVASKRFWENQVVLERARRKIQRLFGEGMHVEFQLVEKLDRDSSGKLRKIISHVNSNQVVSEVCTRHVR